MLVLFAQSYLQICLISLWFGISCSVGNFFSPKWPSLVLTPKCLISEQTPYRILFRFLQRRKKLTGTRMTLKLDYLSLQLTSLARGGIWNKKLVTCFFRLGFPELMSAVGVLNILYSPLLLLLAKVSKPDPEINVSRERLFISSLASNRGLLLRYLAGRHSYRWGIWSLPIMEDNLESFHMDFGNLRRLDFGYPLKYFMKTLDLTFLNLYQLFSTCPAYSLSSASNL